MVLANLPIGILERDAVFIILQSHRAGSLHSFLGGDALCVPRPCVIQIPWKAILDIIADISRQNRPSLAESPEPGWAWGLERWLRELVPLAEDQGSIPSIYLWLPTICHCSSKGCNDYPLLTSLGIKQGCGTHTYMYKTLTHKIKTSKNVF